MRRRSEPRRGDRDPGTASSASRRVLGAGVGLVLGAVVLGPALRRGFLLTYDMVFVPRLPVGDRVLGVDGAAPRAVPNDLLVALASQVLPGDVVQKVVLLAVFVGVGAGVAALARTHLGAAVAALVACWNPYVAERLAIGHWGFLLGYAVLPWVATGAVACRDGARRGWARLAAPLVLAAATGATGGVLAVLVALCVLVLPGRREGAPSGLLDRLRRVRWVLLVAALANAPWWWPFLVSTPGAGDPAGVAAFAARADTPLGVAASLVTGGGIWHDRVWFPERASTVLAVLGLVAALAGVLAWLARRGWREHPASAGLALAGVVGLVLAALPATRGGRELMTWVVTQVPGGGLLRDSHKLVAPWVLLLAVGAACLTELLADWLERQQAGVLSAVVVLAALPLMSLLTLPSLAWGGAKRWTPVAYPAEVLATAQLLEQAPPGRVAVFPWIQYRRFPWNGDRVVLDPWPRLLSRTVLVDDDLPLRDSVVRGESADAAAIGAASAPGGDLVGTLRARGVRHVLVLTDQPPAAARPALPGLTPVRRTPSTLLYDLGPVSAASAQPVVPRRRYLGLAGGVAAVLLSAASLLVPDPQPARPRPPGRYTRRRHRPR